MDMKGVMLLLASNIPAILLICAGWWMIVHDKDYWWAVILLGVFTIHTLEYKDNDSKNKE